MALSEDLRKQIENRVKTERVVLFMKGTRAMPQCGFSAQVVQILDELLDTYQTADVLGDPMLRDGIKEFSNWPTIPQLYIDGQFVGGCDIIKDLYGSGELQKLLGISEQSVAAPAIKLTDTAMAAIRGASGDVGENEVLHLEISPRFQYGLFFGPRTPGEIECNADGIVICLDKASAKRAGGVVIDFVEGPGGSAGFKIENPNEPARVKALSAKELKAMMEREPNLRLYDVRTEAEREIAVIAGDLWLDGLARTELMNLEDKRTPLVFYCHHGVRSMNAAQQVLSMGFQQVFNLSGGIDAWSLTVDPSIRRY